MSTVQEIERAIESLQPSDYATLLAWLDERRDAAAGKGTPLDEFLRPA